MILVFTPQVLEPLPPRSPLTNTTRTAAYLFQDQYKSTKDEEVECLLLRSCRPVHFRPLCIRQETDASGKKYREERNETEFEVIGLDIVQYENGPEEQHCCEDGAEVGDEGCNLAAGRVANNGNVRASLWGVLLVERLD